MWGFFCFRVVRGILSRGIESFFFVRERWGRREF